MARNRRWQICAPDGTVIKTNDKSQKCGLGRLLRKKFRGPFTHKVYEMCYAATEICALGSMYFLYKANDACEYENTLDYFDKSQKEAENEIKRCFHSVLQDNCTQLEREFLGIMIRGRPALNNIRNWPAQSALGNALNSLKTQYITNVKTNLKRWCYKRMMQFFLLKRYQLNNDLPVEQHITELDVRNATKELVFGTLVHNRTANVDVLLEEAYLIGVPRNRNETFKYFVTVNWFRCIPIFINIQRQITAYHKQHDALNALWRRFRKKPQRYPQPTIKQPPKIKNFLAIPVHDFKMKNIRIDRHLFHQIACTIGALKLAKGQRKARINISKEQYEEDFEFYWDQVFNMQKINKIKGKWRFFDYAIMTNSVSVSLQFKELQRDAEQMTDEQVVKKLANDDFKFAFGMDTGMRTWNAVNRLHLPTMTEVSDCLNKECIVFYLKHWYCFACLL